MALVPLRNALTFLDNAPSAMNLREDPLTSSTLWSSNSQYFKNDVVTSSSTGGMFVFAGAGDAKTTVRGGQEPWEESFASPANWVSLAPYGLNDVTSSPLTITAPPVTANTVVVATSGSFTLDSDLATPGATYLVSWQGLWTNTGNTAFTATDRYTWSFTPNGTAGAPITATVLPGDAAVSPYGMSGSAVVVLPIDGDTITGALTSGPSALGALPLFTNLRVTYSRLF